MWIQFTHKIDYDENNVETNRHQVVVNTKSIHAIEVHPYERYNRATGDEEVVGIIPKVYTVGGDSWWVFDKTFDELAAIVTAPGNVIKHGGNI